MPHETPAATAEAVIQPSSNELIASGLNTYESMIRNAVAAYEQDPGAYSMRHIPDSLSSSADRETMLLLKDEASDPALISRYAGIHDQAQMLYGRMPGMQVNKKTTLDQLEKIFGNERLGEAFRSEVPDGPLHEILLTGIQQANQAPASESWKSLLNSHVYLLQAGYEVEHPTDLLKHDGDDPYRSAIREQLLMNNGIKQLYLIELDSKLGRGPRSSIAEKTVRRNWMRDIVLAATDITDPELADDYIFAAAQPVFTPEDGKVGDIVHKIDTLGAEKLATISEFSGICALNDYSLDQLERMYRVATSDPEEIANLQQHDVIALLSNSMGDDTVNGILSQNPELLDDRERTLFFEIQSLEDINMTRRNLRRVGIKPSTLVFAAHGFVGTFPIHPKPAINGVDRFIDIVSIHKPNFLRNLNETEGVEKGQKSYPMHDMQRFARFVERDMQPSRGIDDDSDSIGTKKIAFIMCSAAGEKPMRDIDPTTGEEVELADASIASQLATDLAQSGAASNITIYGADQAMQLRATKRGLRYFKKRRSDHGNAPPEWIPNRAMKFMLAGGKVKREVVNEVPLRNFDKS